MQSITTLLDGTPTVHVLTYLRRITQRAAQDVRRQITAENAPVIANSLLAIDDEIVRLMERLDARWEARKNGGEE